MVLSPVDQIENKIHGASVRTEPVPEAVIEVALLTGGQDWPYVSGLAKALVSKSINLDFIGSDELDLPEIHSLPRLRFLNLRGSTSPRAPFREKITRILRYYARLFRYAWAAKPRIFHIVWNNRFEHFDRTLLMLYYKLLGKKVVLTAHNVNAARRDANDSALNRLTLKIQYRLADHIFVHTEKMKRELLNDFGVRERAVTVIPFGINNSAPSTSLTSRRAKQRLGVTDRERTILFFGRIGPYKGLEFLVAAFHEIAARNPDYRLIIAGEPKAGSEQYLAEIQQAIERSAHRERITQRIEFIPDEETEVYFKAADVLALPYTDIFQSGVPFLAYRFGLPVIAADVGSFREDIAEGHTGFLCRPRDPASLATAIETYFESDLFRNLENRRQEIRDYANARHSWDVVGKTTRAVYDQLLEGTRG